MLDASMQTMNRRIILECCTKIKLTISDLLPIKKIGQRTNFHQFEFYSIVFGYSTF